MAKKSNKQDRFAVWVPCFTLIEQVFFEISYFNLC